MLKNAYFLQKKYTKIATASGIRLKTPASPRVVSSVCYFNFAGSVFSTKYVLVLS